MMPRWWFIALPTFAAFGCALACEPTPATADAPSKCPSSDYTSSGTSPSLSCVTTSGGGVMLCVLCNPGKQCIAFDPEECR